MIMLFTTLLVIGIYYITNRTPKKSNTVKDFASEIKKLLKKINPSNQETIKAKLFDLLDSYKEEKHGEFVSALCVIRKNKDDVSSQMNRLRNEIYNLESQMHDVSDEVGASLLYQKEKLENCLSTLTSMYNNVLKQESEIESKLNRFSSDFLCKQAEIQTLIIVNPFNSNTSNIDVEINKLMNEFKDLEFKKKTEIKVNAKINNIEEVKDESYDETSYIEKFRQFKSAGNCN